MEQQFVVTNTIRQTEIPVLLDIWVTNPPSFKMLFPQKQLLVLTFLQIHNILTNWSVEDQSRFFSLVYKCVSVGYNKLLFHERCTSSCNIYDSFLWQYSDTSTNK